MQGRIIVNGNVAAESELIYQTKDALTGSRHRDPEIADVRSTLLITAAWRQQEHREEHIKRALYEIGIEPRFHNGYDQNVRNLSAYHALQRFEELDPSLFRAYGEREQLIRQTRSIYLEKNSFYIAQMRRALNHLRQVEPGADLSSALARSGRTVQPLPGRFRGERLLGDFLAEDLAHNVQQLVENDDRLTRLLVDLDRQFREGVGLTYHDLWLEQRAALERSILAASSVLIFGGHLETLHRCLNFYDLGPVFVEALRRGTTFVTVSAGSLLLCDRIIIYDDFAQGKEFHLFDRGFGLVRDFQIFPHCDDRIQTDNPDNLSYLSFRFGQRKCVGLNQGSFLLLEQNGEELHARSCGTDDGVYIFDRSGQKRRYDYGDELTLTKPAS